MKVLKCINPLRIGNEKAYQQMIVELSYDYLNFE